MQRFQSQALKVNDSFHIYNSYLHIENQLIFRKYFQGTIPRFVNEAGNFLLLTSYQQHLLTIKT